MADPLTADGLARFSATAAAHVGDETVPGLVALVARGDQVHAEALGSLSIGGPAVRRDSLFRIASVTKPVTGAATLALVREGLLSLDEPVGRLLPELAAPRVLRRMDGPLGDTVPARRPITVRDLLTFTFGFGDTAEMFAAGRPWPVMAQAGALHLATIGPPDPAVQPGPDAWIAGLGSLPLLAQPGERWFYNTGASVLGVLLGRAAGQPFADVLRTRLFQPLGMTDTGFWTAATGRLASAFRSAPGGGLEVWDKPEGLWSRPRAFPDGASGLVSTADDLLAFSRMLLRGGDPVLTAGPGHRDDHGPAHPGAEGARRPQPGFLHRRRLGLLHLRRHRRAAGRGVRLGRRIRLHLAGRSGPGPDRHRGDPADVRQPRAAAGARGAAGGGLRGPRLSRGPGWIPRGTAKS